MVAACACKVQTTPSRPPVPCEALLSLLWFGQADGALACLAAWDVHRARLFGRCERKNGIAAFHRLVAQVMGREPYRSARRVLLIADNGSCHRGRRAADRLRTRWPNIVLVHTPVHASWLNQIEVYFSVVQRKLLTPSDFESSADLKRNVIALPGSLPTGRQTFQVDLHATRPTPNITLP